MQNYNLVIEYIDRKCYFLDGKYHRIDGPAEEYKNGAKYWYKNGLLHRTNGPAIEHINGNKEWYQNGLRHRIDGPAEEYKNGVKYWYYEGGLIDCDSQEEFERYIKLKLFW